MGVQCGVVGYDDGVLRDEHGVGTNLQGLRARAGRFGYGNGSVKTYSLVLAGCLGQFACTKDARGSLTTTAKQRGRCGKAAS